jgi:hypothetical protein
MAEQQINIKDRIKEEFVKCATDPVHFMKKYYMIQHPKRGRQLFDLYPFQEKVLRLFQKNDYSIINKSRQLGISTLVSAYSLWLMLFNKDKNVLVIATKQETAKNMVTKVRFAYQNLPSWLRIAASEDNRLSLRLTNGSQIKAVSAAGDAGRSEAVSLLVIDEAAFIDNIETIFTAAQQTLATGGGCIALSTPNGVGNWFHKTYIVAQEKKNKFLPISLPWTVHPERDQTWRDDQDVILGKRNAAQECDCNFATSGNTVIEPEILTWYEDNMVDDPIERRGLDKAFWIWEYADPVKYYAIIADVARGDGNDYSAFHVIDIESLTQVAEYKSQVDTRDFANILLSVGSEYNNALLVVENANIGWDVIQTIIERGYTNIHYSYKQDQGMDFTKYVDKYNRADGLVPGFSTTEKTRPLVIERMRDFIENKVVIIKSVRLLEELRSFIWKNGRAQAMQSYNDDLVMSFAIAMYLRETSLRFKKTADSLTYAALDGFTRTQDTSIAYNSNNQYNQNPWIMNVNSPQGQEFQDLTWLI